MELCMRVAMEKFYNSGVCKTELEAIKKFNTEHILKGCRGFSQHEWRKQHTFNVFTDNVVRAYKPVFEHIYKRCSGKHAKPG